MPSFKLISGPIHCREASCKQSFPSDLSEARHWGKAHGPQALWRHTKGIRCPIEGCDQKFRRPASMARHLLLGHQLKPKDHPGLIPSEAAFAEFRRLKRQPKEPSIFSNDAPPPLPTAHEIVATAVLEAAEANGHTNGNGNGEQTPDIVNTMRTFINACIARAQGNTEHYVRGARDTIQVFQSELTQFERYVK